MQLKVKGVINQGLYMLAKRSYIVASLLLFHQVHNTYRFSTAYLYIQMPLYPVGTVVEVVKTRV